MEEAAVEVIHDGRLFPLLLHLNIAESVVAETRMPLLHAFPLQHIGERIPILRKGVGAALGDQAVRIQQFARDHGDPRPAPPSEGDLRPAGEILPQVVDGNPRDRMCHRDGIIPLEGFDRRNVLRHKFSARPRNDGRGGPAFAMKSGLVPSRLLEPCVVIFATVDGAEHDGPGRCFPPAIADDCLLAPVRETKAQLHRQLGLTEAPGELGIAALGLGNVVHAIAQQDADCVGPGPQQSRHLVSMGGSGGGIAYNREELVDDSGARADAFAGA